MDEEIVLLPDKGVYWPAKQTLVIGDPHFGKDSSFRWAGIPVPAGATDLDLERLSKMIAVPLRGGVAVSSFGFRVSSCELSAAGSRHHETRNSKRETATTKRLIILGDFFHTRHDPCEQTLAALRRWRARHASLEIVLVRGSHDLHAGQPPEDMGFTRVPDAMADGPFLFSHDALETGEHYCISAHIHPCVNLSDGTGSRLRTPCFWFNDAGLVLPSFGSCATGHAIEPMSGDRVFAVGGGEIVEIPIPRVSVNQAARQAVR